MFRREIRSQKVKIQAAQNEVWDILFDIDSYPQWNPFTHKVESLMKVGASIHLHVCMPKRGDRMQVETVCVMDAPAQMAWNMQLGFASLLRARRDQYIEKISESACSYETVDVFEGLLAPLVYHLFREDVEGGFNRMAMALRQRAEQN